MDESLEKSILDKAYGEWQRHRAGLGGFLGGMFGNSGQPYKDYQDELKKYYQQGQMWQQPFWQAGAGAVPQFQEWLGGQKDPAEFINNLMGQYKESPWAHYEQEQAVRRGQNMGSATGYTGSTPLAQFMQQNAENISSQDMNNWLGHVLGINTQYGAGLGSLMGGGQQAGNTLSGLAGTFGPEMGAGRFGERAGKQQDTADMWGGLFNFLF